MAELVVGIAGAALGGIPGIGFTAWTGFQGGLAVGQLLFGGPSRGVASRLQDIRVTSSVEGSPLPIVYGRQRVGGNIVWASGLRVTSNRQGGKGGGGGSTTESAATDLAVAICEGPVVRIRRIWANETIIYSNRPESPHSESSPVYASSVNPSNIRIYLGTDDHEIDPAISAALGSDSIAFGHTCTLILDDFNLAPYGNSLPNFTVEVDTGDWNLAEVLGDLCDRSGVDPEDYDFSGVEDIVVRGAVIQGGDRPDSLIQRLEKAYLFDLIEFDWKISARKRGLSVDWTVPQNDIGFGTASGQPPFTVVRQSEVELPAEMEVLYFDEEADFKQAAQAARRRIVTPVGRASESTDLVLTADEASVSAQATLRSLWTGRLSFTTSLGWRWLKIAPGDRINVPVDGVTRAYRVTRMRAVLMGPVFLELVRDEASDYSPQAAGQQSGGGGGAVLVVDPPEWAVVDGAAMLDAYASDLYLFAAAARDKTEAPYLSGAIFSEDPIRNPMGEPTDRVFLIAGQAALGRTLASSAGVLPAGAGAWDEPVDNTSTVDVDFFYGDPESCTTQEMIEQNQNLAMVGGEIINFSTATEISPGIFRLSGLLRGRRGTEDQREGHTQGDPVFILRGFTPSPFKFSPSEIGVSHSFRLIDDSNAYAGGLPAFSNEVTLSGRSAKPYSPVHLASSRDEGGDVTLSWIPRVRLSGEWVDGGDVPADEPSEAFEIEIYDGPSLVRTILVDGQRSATYLAADQESDLGSQAEFEFRVRQRTTRLGLVAGMWSQLAVAPAAPA